MCYYAGSYTILCTPLMKHPDTFARRLLHLPQELHAQSRFHLSGVLQTIGWDCICRYAHRAGLLYWDYPRLVPFVWGRRERPARDRGQCLATDTTTIRKNSRHGVADLDAGKGGKRTASVSILGTTRLVSFLTTNGYSHILTKTKSWVRSCLDPTCFILEREYFHMFRIDVKDENQSFIVRRGRALPSMVSDDDN